MNTTSNKYINVAYELFSDFDGKNEMVEKATAEHPFHFISDMGTTLDAFEAHIKPLAKGEKFDFTLSVDEAYGPYEQERVLELDKAVFTINGTIVEIVGEKVSVDLNHPLAGKELHFVGEVVENREATKEEIQEMLNMLSGEGCGGGCGGCGGGCGDHECGGCGEEGSGCGCH